MKIQTTLLLSLLMLSAMTVSAATPVTQPQSLEDRVLLLERRMETLNDILLRLDQLQLEIQQLRGEVDMQKYSLDAMTKRQRDLYMDIDQRLGQLSGGAAPTTSLTAPPGAAADQAPEPAAPQGGDAGQIVPFEAPPSTAAPSAGPVMGDAASPPSAPSADPAQEQAAYQQAFDLLMQRRYEDASKAFRRFLLDYPAGQFTANAQYWLAEAHYVNREFDTALSEFNRVLQQHPASAKVPDAKLKIGFIQYEQQQWDEARATLEAVTRDYAATTAAQLAQKRLERMRVEGH